MALLDEGVALLEVGVVLLEEVYHCEGRLLEGCLMYAQAIPSESVHFLLPRKTFSSFSSKHYVCLTHCHVLPDDKRLNLFLWGGDQ